MQKLVRGVNLSHEEVAALKELAKRHRTLAVSGPSEGEPSWRELIIAIAAGKLTLTRKP